MALTAAPFVLHGAERKSAADERASKSAQPPPPPTGPFKLPELGYAYNALEPAIDAQTMEIHHTKHHQTYVMAANIALKDYPDLASKSAEEILRSFNKVPTPVREAMRNYVGGHVNHTLFWDILAPGGPKMPEGAINSAITRDFQSFDDFIRELSSAAMSRFGSGWAWLNYYNRKLTIGSSANQDSPLMDGAIPILGIDVWEHAYYLTYQNRRIDYVKAVLGLINWDRVSQRLAAARKLVG